jgi:hypothetical protein
MTMESKFNYLDSIFFCNLNLNFYSNLKILKERSFKMKTQNTIAIANKHKLIIINFLYLTTLIIIFLGIFFCIFSLVNHVNFKVLNSSIPGAVFGLLVLYLGIRYYFSVAKLKDELIKTSSKFSWNNFKEKNLKKLSQKK